MKGKENTIHEKAVCQREEDDADVYALSLHVHVFFCAQSELFSAAKILQCASETMGRLSSIAFDRETSSESPG